MNAPASFPSSEALSQEVRVVTKRYGGIQGPVFTVAFGDRYFAIGEMALSLLQRGYSPDDLDLSEVDPDAPEEEY